MAHTMKMHIMFIGPKYLTCRMQRTKNHATGMERMISDIPTMAKKPDPVAIQMYMNTILMLAMARIESINRICTSCQIRVRKRRADQGR